MARDVPRHELSDLALKLHGPLAYRVGHQAPQWAHDVANALHAAGHNVRVAPDPDFPRWLEVSDPATGEVHLRIKGA